MNLSIILIILGVTLALNLLLGIFVFLKNKKSIINISFLLFTIGLVGWEFTIFYILCFSANLLVARLAFSFAALLLTGFLMFSIVFPEKNKIEKSISYLILSGGIIFFIIPLIESSIVGSVLSNYNFITISFGSIYWLYLIFVPVYTLSTLIILVRKYIKSTGLYKLQLKYLFLGSSVFLATGLMTNLLLPSIFNIWQYNGLGPASSVIMVAAIAYAIIRYHLMDISIVIRKGLIFTILSTIISFIYIYSVSFLNKFFSEPLNFLIPSILIVFGFMPLKNFIEFSTDKIFFRRRYNFSDVVKKIEEVVLSAGLNLDKALEGVNRIIEDCLKIKKNIVLILFSKNNIICRLLGDKGANLEFRRDNPIINYLESHKGTVLDKHLLIREISDSDSASVIEREAVRELEALDFCLAVPIELKDELIGVYLLKHKLSGTLFSKEDIRLLEHVAWGMGFTIDNARSYEELKKIENIKSEFISFVSHQMKTPISIARWSLESIFGEKRKMSPQKINEFLKEVYQGVLSIDRGFDQLVTVLEIQERGVFLRLKFNNMDFLIESSVKKAGERIKEKRLKLNTDLAKLPKIICDCDKISEVLDTLIDNAVNYTPEGGNIKISLFEKKIKGRDSFVVSVCDNGISIREEERDHIFKKFYRGNAARSMFTSGFGLGLFIAKNFIQAHGGDLWFESNFTGKGTTFFFSIPTEKMVNL